MTNVEIALLGFLAGIVLGTVFFGGLWLTTTRFSMLRRALVVTVGSFVGRMLFSLVGLLIVVRLLGFTGIMSALLGFVAMQIVFVRISMKRTPTRCRK